MKHILLLLIRLYWRLPKHLRRECIFKCSCSCYVYDQTRMHGFRSGINALQQRFKQCRPGYSRYKTPDGKEWIILKDQTCVPKEETHL